jgi:hypothetical protein
MMIRDTRHGYQLQFSLVALLQLFQDRFLQRLGLRCRCPTVFDLSIFANQELFKIPFDPLQAHDSRLGVLHPLPQRIRIISIDLCLAQDGKGDTVIELTERLDIIVGSWLLPAELVAGKSEDEEIVRVFRCHFLVQGFESGVLRSKPTFGSYVDDEDNFVGERGERVWFALFCRRMISKRFDKLEERGHTLSRGEKS